tara:strand:+ start:335 stop:499 length:165 start_codon:yes stop_codon:yes gene_type:complete
MPCLVYSITKARIHDKDTFQKTKKDLKGLLINKEVELRGVEPLTPRMPFWCSPN